MSINKAIISGNLTRDIEIRQTQGGMEIGSFTVAVNDRRRDANGEWRDFPSYIDCTMFGNRASALAPYLTKGMKVAVDGKLRWSQWERDGQKRSKIEVIVDDIELMSGNRPQQQPQQQYQMPASAYQPSYQQSPSYQQASVYSDDIPF